MQPSLHPDIFPYLVHKVFLVERIHAHNGLLATCWTVVSSGIR